MKQFFDKGIRTANAILHLALLLACVCVCMRGIGIIADALYPLPAIIVTATLTFVTFGRKMTGVLAVLGLTLYLSSWVVVTPFGIWPAMLVWSIGLGIWFFAVCQSFVEIRRPKYCYVKIK